MSTEREHFWQVMQKFPMPGDKEALGLLTAAASKWREANNYFGAGYAMGWAGHAALGDSEQLYSCITTAIHDYTKCVE